ncbi:MULTISPECIES: ABC transporter permease [Rhodomicrobium]|uniref:ABC transporter permease n=1 Tax=Rhodomicrobium TaxID=1068 RepID=UPI000B4B5C31|nr:MULTISPECIES: ABC transporter permease [Rhodomicrobium]
MFLSEMQRWLYGGAIGGLKTVAAGADPEKLALAMGFAALFGLIHALMPGHGKSVIVSYYLGRPGRMLGGVATSALLVLTHVGMAVVFVLAGYIVIERSFAAAGRAPAFNAASSVLIVAIGLWVLYRALRGHDHAHAHDSRAVAIAAGFVPCPLTTFIMVYAVGNGIVLAGLIVTAAMAAGMIATVAAFALAAILLRERFFALLVHSAAWRQRLGRIAEALSGAAIVGSGVWLMISRG